MLPVIPSDEVERALSSEDSDRSWLQEKSEYDSSTDYDCLDAGKKRKKKKKKNKVLHEKSQHAYNLNLKTAMKALDDNIEKDKPDSASDTENASETENVSMDTNSDHDYSTPVSGTQKKKKTKKKVLQEKSQHAYNLKLKTAMKALDDNIEKDKPDLASDTKNISETENVSMDTNSDHDYSPPVPGTQKKFALDAPKIFQIMVQNNTGKDQSHNKRHYCAYCQRSDFTNFAKHLIDMHSGPHGADEVNAFMSYPKKSKERDNRIAEIRIRGNHMINMATLQAGQGMFVAMRRPSPHADWKVSDYSPCPFCKVWVLRTLLTKHQKNCVVRNNKETTDNLPCINEHELGIEADLVAGRIGLEASDELKAEVFTTMRNDYVGMVAKKDPLICCLGNISMKRNIGNKATRPHNVSSAMRLSARCLIELRDLQGKEELKKNLTWYEALVPEQYENIVRAVFAVCREACEDSVEVEVERDEDELEAPSNALKLSYDIGRLVGAKTTKAIAMTQEKNPAGEIDRKNAKRLMQLYKMNWQVDVLKRARHCLRERKLNATIELPDPKDIAIFAKFMFQTMKKAKKPENYDEFKLLQIWILARLIQYNRRRPGEMQVLKYVCYTLYSN